MPKTNTPAVDSKEFYRLNFILQDSYATTTRNYLSKLIELVLYDAEKPLPCEDIIQALDDRQSLTFDSFEIKNAVKKNRNIVQFDGKYDLTPKRRNTMQHEPSIDSLLSGYVDEACSLKELEIRVDPNTLKTLLMKYIYYCFNSNVEQLNALINGHENIDTEHSFTASNEEILAINSFLSWNNREKNEFIYHLVSYGYIYCSLTTKKDVVLSERIFRHKEFYLDANIIFRLAGLNNDDRRQTTITFIKKCKESKISLLYSNQTAAEVFDVIQQRVFWIKSLTNGHEPLSPSEIGRDDDDIYNLYVEWVRRGNDYDDYTAFHSYLINCVNEVLDDLIEVEIPDYSLVSQSRHSEYSTQLREYKDELSAWKIEQLSSLKDDNDETSDQTDKIKKIRRTHSRRSAEVDVANYLYVVDKRKQSREGSIFSTNQFIISADHYFMKWAAEKNNSVPVVVLPSVWLIILLRFTSRTDDDFKAFCAFMSLREHKLPDDIDTFKITQVASRNTSDKELIVRIISEVIQHKDDYQLVDSDAESVVQKAFDKIRSEDSEILASAYHKQMEIQRADGQKRSDDEKKIALVTANEKALRTAMEIEVRRKTTFFSAAKSVFSVLRYIIVILFIICVVLWAYKIEPVYSFCERMIPVDFQQRIEQKAICVGGAWVGIVAVNEIIKAFFAYMSGDKRKERIRKQYRKKFVNVSEETG